MNDVLNAAKDVSTFSNVLNPTEGIRILNGALNLAEGISSFSNALNPVEGIRTLNDVLNAAEVVMPLIGNGCELAESEAV